VLSGYEGAASVRGARPPKTANVPTATKPAKESARKQKAAKATRIATGEAGTPQGASEKPRDFGTDDAE
jgi:hypothetical protein